MYSRKKLNIKIILVTLNKYYNTGSNNFYSTAVKLQLLNKNIEIKTTTVIFNCKIKNYYISI